MILREIDEQWRQVEAEFEVAWKQAVSRGAPAHLKPGRDVLLSTILGLVTDEDGESRLRQDLGGRLTQAAKDSDWLYGCSSPAKAGLGVLLVLSMLAGQADEHQTLKKAAELSSAIEEIKKVFSGQRTPAYFEDQLQRMEWLLAGSYKDKLEGLKEQGAIFEHANSWKHLADDLQKLQERFRSVNDSAERIPAAFADEVKAMEAALASCDQKQIRDSLALAGAVEIKSGWEWLNLAKQVGSLQGRFRNHGDRIPPVFASAIEALETACWDREFSAVKEAISGCDQLSNSLDRWEKLRQRIQSTRKLLARFGTIPSSIEEELQSFEAAANSGESAAMDSAKDSLSDKAQEKYVYDMVQAKENAANYERYVQTYPNGKYTESAKQWIEENKCWKEKSEYGILSHYQSYLKEFPSGRHAGEAQEGIKRLRRATARKYIIMFASLLVVVAIGACIYYWPTKEKTATKILIRYLPQLNTVYDRNDTGALSDLFGKMLQEAEPSQITSQDFEAVAGRLGVGSKFQHYGRIYRVLSGKAGYEVVRGFVDDCDKKSGDSSCKVIVDKKVERALLVKNVVKFADGTLIFSSDNKLVPDEGGDLLPGTTSDFFLEAGSIVKAVKLVTSGNLVRYKGAWLPRGEVDKKIAAAKKEEERLAAAKAEEERLTAANKKEEERLAAAKKEEERLAATKKEEERLAAAKKEEERLAATKKEEERLAVELMFVKGGCYEMGCVSWFNFCINDEKPVHEVCVSDFLIGKYEVTQGQWKNVMGNNPSKFTEVDNYPVENVSWNDVQTFIQRLNQKTGKGYRLPTEAEWEYAARSGGKKEKFAGGSNLDAVAWHNGNSGGTTHPVGTKAANGLGIYDMSGNVWEWCSDWYGDYYGKSSKNNPLGPSLGSLRVFRGGSWGSDAGNVRAACRGRRVPDRRHDYLGFRLVLPPGQQ